MMEPVLRISGDQANAVNGRVKYDKAKLAWNMGMVATAIILIPFYTNLAAIILFVVTTYLSLLIGHSAGMHRMMIHRTFEVPKPVERVMIYIGVLVGMGGPYTIIRTHDLRDWAQRQPQCHDFFSHKQSFFKDLWWQLSSTFEFTQAPKVTIEPKFSDDKFYQFLEHTWRLHQILPALLLYYLGGLPFVVWGIFVRVSVSIVGHWSITYCCHTTYENSGPGKWLVKGACVQARNIPGLGLLTYGECWHNNHHAFPESARIGIEAGQPDPTWWLIKLLACCGIARNIGQPRLPASREDLQPLNKK